MKKAIVLGAGISGTAAAMKLTEEGYQVRVYDQARLNPEQRAKTEPYCSRLTDEAKTVDIEGGEEFAVISPGIPLDNPLVPKGINVISEVDLGVKFLGQPRVAVTGTNGKTTVTLLLAKMLGLRALGNVGSPLVSQTPGPYVAELSSYQLESSKLLAPKVALWLNQSPDHLARHKTMDAYISAKGRIFSSASYSVLNADDPYFEQISKFTQGEVILFGESSVDCSLKNQSICFKGSSSFDLRNWKLLGKHNRLNCTAAICAAKLAGASDKDIQIAIDCFEAPEHRLEVLPEKDGVIYINDSKSTNVSSTVMALQAVSELDYCGTLHLILGGQSKNESLEPLSLAIPAATQVYSFGQDAPSFANTLGGQQFNELPETLHNLVATKDDVVLFSPACASFDQFKNFEERGKAFKRLVH